MQRILNEKPAMIPALHTDPLVVAPPRPGRIKKFIAEAPYLTALKTSKFSPEAILLLARFLAGALDRAFSRLVHLFLSEERQVRDLAASLDDMSLRRRKDPRRSAK